MIPEIEDAFYTKNPNFKKMMKIITSFQNTPALCFENVERHHIVPRSFFRNTGKQINSTKENLVVLPFADHALVHYYAAQCAKPVIKDSMLRAMNMFFKVPNIDESFALKNKDKLDKGKQMCSKNMWFEWAKENDQENYKRYLEHQKEKKIRTLKKKFNLSFSVHYPRSARTCIATLKRISKQLGKTRKEYKKVICVTTGEIFESTGAAGRKMGLSGNQISTLCQHSGRHRTVKGFVFEYLENYAPGQVYKYHCRWGE